MAVATFITSPSEAEGLIRWGILFALASDEEELILVRTEETPEEDFHRHIKSWKDEGHPVLSEISIHLFEGKYSEPELLEQVRELAPDILLLGQNRAVGLGESVLQIHRKVFEKAVCNTILIRLSKRPVQESDNVLVPSAGGPHSTVALKLGSRIARRFGGQITPLFVEADIGEEDGQAVGMRILDRVLDQAGVDKNDTEHVDRKVRVSNEVGKAIAETVQEKPFDLILLGASNSLSVKRKLFGVLPHDLMAGDESPTVAVIRRKRPVQHRMRDKMERFLTVKIPQLDRESRVALFDRLQTQSTWSFDFVLLMLLSTGIASLGLMQNSPAVVIGAMLVAPLMTPLLGSGLSLVQGNLPLMRSCLKSICFGFLAALVVGTLFGFMAPISALTNELAARGGPNLLDFGVAAISGIAASYCVARPGLSSALAGVAIAAALVPPIATVGISLALREFSNASGAALLFGTNVVAIILSSALTFFLIGIRGQLGTKKLWAHRTFIVLLMALGLLLVPLSTVLLSKAAEELPSGEQDRLALVEAMKEELQRAGITHQEIEVTDIQRGENPAVRFRLEAAQAPPPSLAAEVSRLSGELLGTDEDVNVTIKTELITTSDPTGLGQ